MNDEIRKHDDPTQPPGVVAALLTETLGVEVTEADVVAARSGVAPEAAPVAPAAAPDADAMPKPKRASKAKPEAVLTSETIITPDATLTPEAAPPTVRVIKTDGSVRFPGSYRFGVGFGDVYSGERAAYLWSNHRGIVEPL